MERLDMESVGRAAPRTDASKSKYLKAMEQVLTEPFKRSPVWVPKIGRRKDLVTPLFRGQRDSKFSCTEAWMRLLRIMIPRCKRRPLHLVRKSAELHQN